MRNSCNKRVLMIALAGLSILLSGCVGIAPGATPVSNFELERYLGKWYEIARLDHSFERGLSDVTADYRLREGGGVRVLNSGFSSAKNERKFAEGKAFFVSGEHIGHLKVSFFGPFYGSYVIYELEKDNYDYAFITSYKNSYLWLLSRTPTVERPVIDKFIASARALGVDPHELIFVDQSRHGQN